jgi:glycosyltransferase involved in cell wall biosynthesis
VDVNAPEQIYNKILWIFSNQDQMPSIINNAQESVKAYQWPVIQQQLLTLYQN